MQKDELWRAPIDFAQSTNFITSSPSSQKHFLLQPTLLPLFLCPPLPSFSIFPPSLFPFFLFFLSFSLDYDQIIFFPKRPLKTLFPSLRLLFSGSFSSLPGFFLSLRFLLLLLGGAGLYSFFLKKKKKKEEEREREGRERERERKEIVPMGARWAGNCACLNIGGLCGGGIREEGAGKAEEGKAEPRLCLEDMA